MVKPHVLHMTVETLAIPGTTARIVESSELKAWSQLPQRRALRENGRGERKGQGIQP